jgi:fibronectin-binding autotransporter adhesin
MKTRTTIALGVITASSLVAHAGVVTSWASAVSGDWNVGSNWDTGNVPGISDSVLLGHAGAYTVTSTSSQSMGSLMITNPNVVFNTGNATTQTIAGDFHNDGSVSVNFAGNVSATSLLFDADSMLTGSGSILLNSSATRARILTGAGFTFTQGSSHTIHGQGQIAGAMINNGTVSADAGVLMSLLSNDKTNNNLMEATNGSELLITGITISQGGAGVLRADGVGSQVSLTGTTISGGSVDSINSGEVSVTGSSTVDGVAVSGVLDVENAVTLSVTGSLDNSGTMTVNPAGNVSATQITFVDSMTVSGNGTFKLSSLDSRARILTSPGQTVTMNPMLTIHGQGRIEASMINNGLISSDVAELRLTTNDKINNDTMEAIGGSVMEINGITITQGASGVIESDGAGSQIELLGAAVIGGTLRSSNGADVSFDSSSSLDSVIVSGDLNIQNAITLSINNGLTNNGTMTVNPAGNVSATQITFNDSMTIGGTGEIVLASFDSRARILTGAGAVLTTPATQTIRGFGRIEADMVNNGLISSDVGGEIRFVSNSKVNNSMIEAVNASNVEVSSITIDQSGGGVLSANDAGSQIELLGATIVGGMVSAAAGADVTIDSSSTLDGVTIIGDLNIQNANTLSINTSLTNSGVIDVNPSGNVSATQILFNDSMTVVGVGSIKLSSFDSRARIQTAADKTVTMSSTQTIHGFGRIEASMINNGTISSDVLSQEIRFDSEPKTNNGIIQANNDSNLEFNSITLTQGPAGQILADGAGSEIELVGATISGGSLATSGGADVSVDSVSILDGVDFSGLLNIPNASTLGITFATLNNGTIVVNETGNVSATQLRWDEEIILGGSGTIRLNSNATRARLIPAVGVTQGGIGSEQRLEGIGRISIDLINDGTIAPGLSVGTMSADQPIFFAGIASFEAEVNDAGGDLLDSTSTIELHGTLDVLYVDGFAPTGFWARTIMEGSDITGKFDAVNVPPPGAGFVTRILNTGTEIIVGQTCPSDTNLDGVLNFFDVSAFLAAFTAMDPIADLTGDGQFNFFDVSAFLNDFGVGCPL